MNTPLEKEVCRNLLKYREDVTEIPDYPRLNPDAIRTISKNITKIIYDSVRNENQNTKQNRDAIIELISRWFKPSNGGHMTINEDNRDNFISSLKSTEDDIFNEFQRKISKENFEENVWDKMIKTLEERNKIEIKNKMFNDIIRGLDNLYLKKLGFDCNIPTTSQKNDVGDSISFLKELSDTNGKCTPKFDASRTVIYQRDSNPSIGLGYSLLKLKNCEENYLLLKKIVNEIVNNEKMNETEINFIEYLWNNQDKLNVNPNIYDIIINTFPFLYERPILKLVTFVINVDDDGFSKDYTKFLLDSDIKKFIEKSTSNNKLYYNILSCFYELFILSDYDRKLLRLINSFKDIIRTKR